ncbi:MAG: 50S ribosomal protein L11 methyltransferase [Gammaproteobacteria bacterium]|nr:50S ribosomal protein L11 methyltransferase [Gammaproteobacteria bacterium]
MARPLYYQLTADSSLSAELAESISERLTELGAIAVSLQDGADQPLYEPPLNTAPLWTHTQVTGLFEAHTDPQWVQARLNALLPPGSPCKINMLEDQDWVRAGMDDFHSMRFGKRLQVCPSWETPPSTEAVNIILDPGLAFGTGAHASTALCLEWLDSQQNLQGQTLIDYGCGSGILAIAAAKLGAKHVWAVDEDPQALLATRENAERNQVCSGIFTVLPKQLPMLQADCVLANILALPLISLAPQFASLLLPGGKAVLAGILSEQADAVNAAYTPYFEALEVVEKGHWIRMAYELGIY